MMCQDCLNISVAHLDRCFLPPWTVKDSRPPRTSCRAAYLGHSGTFVWAGAGHAGYGASRRKGLNMPMTHYASDTMRLIRPIAFSVLALGIGHLFFVGRVVLDPSRLHTIIAEAAPELGEPAADLERILILLLTVLTLVGLLALACGIGMLRRLDVARRTWMGLSVVLVLVYGSALVVYARFGAVQCALAAGVVVAVAIASLICLPGRPVQQAFNRVTDP